MLLNPFRAQIAGDVAAPFEFAIATFRSSDELPSNAQAASSAEVFARFPLAWAGAFHTRTRTFSADHPLPPRDNVWLAIIRRFWSKKILFNFFEIQIFTHKNLTKNVNQNIFANSEVDLAAVVVGKQHRVIVHLLQVNSDLVKCVCRSPAIPNGARELCALTTAAKRLFQRLKMNAQIL